MSKPQREELEKDKKDGLKMLESEEEIDDEFKRIDKMSEEQVFKGILYEEYRKRREREEEKKREKKEREEKKPKKNRWFNEDEVSKILEEKVPSEFCTKREGPNKMPLTYLEGNIVIELANVIFGPFGWYTSISNKEVYIDQKNNVTVSAIVRVTLANGAYHEDLGVGTSALKNLQAARENAEKACITDGIKRALRQFGNLLGNSLYDSDYARNLKSVKRPKKIDLDTIRECVDNEKERIKEREEREELERQKWNPVRKVVTMKKEEKKEEQKEEKNEEKNEIDDILKLLDEEGKK